MHLTFQEYFAAAWLKQPERSYGDSECGNYENDRKVK